jgi:hypothetical protein
MIEEEYKQPTYEDYYGNKQEPSTDRVDPFPGVRDPREKLTQPSLNSQRHLRDMPLGTVSEEAELNGMYARGDTPKVPVRQPKATTLEEYHRAN